MFANRIPWVLLLLVWMAGSAWWHVCKIKLLCPDSFPTPAASPAVMVPGLTVTDGNQFRFSTPGNVNFARSGAAINSRGGVGSLLDSLAGYMKANPGKTLIVSGFYSPLEQNTTAFANLGVARANGIKKLLTQRGLADSLVITTGIKKDDLVFSAKGDSIYGGLAFNFGVVEPAPATTPIPPATPVIDQPITVDELANKETFTSVFDPIALYFPLGEARYIKTGETAKFFTEATTYLNRNPGKKLVLTGYTDDRGPDAVNLQLSRDRANAVKAQLRKLGIDASQIRVEAKGEADPKASNSTLSGRKANRRVTVVVQ